MRKQRKEEKGITLVALVVTIIVLIILAGVTLNIILDNDGIINKAKQAADDYKNAQREEQEMLGEIEGYTKSQITTEDEVAEGLVIYEIPEGATVNWTEEVDENGKNQSTITIGESTTNLQETVNQYVWIPVEDINSMVMCSSNTGDSICNLKYDEETNTLKCTNPEHASTATDLVGRLYLGTFTNQIEGENEIGLYKMDFSKRNQSYNADAGNREPAVVTGNGIEYDADSNNLLIAGMPEGSTADDFLTQLKNDFTAMAKGVAKNGGFYISRYEAGANGDSKKRQIVLTEAANDNVAENYMGANLFYGLYNTLRDLNSHRQMIWGCQFDQVVKFLGESAQIGHSDRNLTTSKALSGQNELDKVKNIYDLSGNFIERTLEVESTIYRVHRSSSYPNTLRNRYQSISHRYGYYTTAAYFYDTSRSTLY